MLKMIELYCEFEKEELTDFLKNSLEEVDENLKKPNWKDIFNKTVEPLFDTIEQKDWREEIVSTCLNKCLNDKTIKEFKWLESSYSSSQYTLCISINPNYSIINKTC